MLERYSLDVYVYLHTQAYCALRSSLSCGTMANEARKQIEHNYISKQRHSIPSLHANPSIDIFSCAVRTKTGNLGGFVETSRNVQNCKGPMLSNITSRLRRKSELFETTKSVVQNESIDLSRTSPRVDVADQSRTTLCTGKDSTPPTTEAGGSVAMLDNSSEARLSVFQSVELTNENGSPTKAECGAVLCGEIQVETGNRDNLETSSVPSPSPPCSRSSPHTTSSSWPSSPVLRNKSKRQTDCLTSAISASRIRLQQYRLSLKREGKTNSCISTDQQGCANMKPSTSCQRLKYAVSSRLSRTVTPSPPPVTPISITHPTHLDKPTPKTYQKPISAKRKPDSTTDPMAFIITGNMHGRFRLHRTRSLYIPKWEAPEEPTQCSDTYSSTTESVAAREKPTRGRQIRPKSFHGGDILPFAPLLRKQATNEACTASGPGDAGEDWRAGQELMRPVHTSQTTTSLLSIHRVASSLTLTPPLLSEASNGSISTLDVITAYLEQLRMRGSKQEEDVKSDDVNKSEKLVCGNSGSGKRARTKFTSDKLTARSKEDILILLQSFYDQIQVVSEELVVILQIRHDLREQVEMRRVAIEQLLRLHTDPLLHNTGPFKDLSSPPSIQRSIIDTAQTPSSHRGTS